MVLCPKRYASHDPRIMDNDVKCQKDTRAAAEMYVYEPSHARRVS